MRSLRQNRQDRVMAEFDVVTVRGLRKTYGSRVVVDRLDLDVHAGEIPGLTGANGAGKTTTVECVQGLLEQFGLAERHRSAFSSLSGGERQRLFLVLALLNRPRLVILDELTQGLDPAARRNVWQAIRQLHSGGTTVLLVTHEMAEAEALCDRIIVMRAGRVLDTGTPDELVARHANVATVRFTWPDPPASLLEEMSRLDGVRDIQRTAAQITVECSRATIAHVGAVLVRRGVVPADLGVHVPSLDDVMLSLLDSRPAHTHATSATAELAGGRR
jgi:ABC-2 type transport system ATP-binding protein